MHNQMLGPRREIGFRAHLVRPTLKSPQSSRARFNAVIRHQFDDAGSLCPEPLRYLHSIKP